MRIFVAGATGAIGRLLLPRLLAEGHHVTGTSRTERGVTRLRESGADAVVADALDRPRSTESCGPPSRTWSYIN